MLIESWFFFLRDVMLSIYHDMNIFIMYFFSYINTYVYWLLGAKIAQIPIKPHFFVKYDLRCSELTLGTSEPHLYYKNDLLRGNLNIMHHLQIVLKRPKEYAFWLYYVLRLSHYHSY